MVISRSQTKNGSAFPALTCPLKKFELYHLGALLVWVLLLMGAVCAQGVSGAESEENSVLVNGVTDSTVFGLGKSLRITGTVKQGAISFGGDVIVEGVVEGDVAAIGGSVIQRENSTIGGDVIVLGGIFRSDGAKPPNRNPAAMTMVFAGYQQELRDLMRNPSRLLRPRWSPGYLGVRLLAVLFWFILSLAFTAAMPGTISRGVARLHLTSLRVAFIGLIGVVVIGAGVPICLWLLPETISVLVGLLTLVLIVVAGLFGRVMLYAATGRWLQRKYVPIGKSSEAVALLLGTAFWVILASLPYVWPFVVAIIWVLSLGLALTARYRVGWRRAEESPTF
jgi:hypothetical protein